MPTIITASAFTMLVVSYFVAWEEEEEEEGRGRGRNHPTHFISTQNSHIPLLEKLFVHVRDASTLEVQGEFLRGITSHGLEQIFVEGSDLHGDAHDVMTEVLRAVLVQLARWYLKGEAHYPLLARGTMAWFETTEAESLIAVDGGP